MGLTVKQKQNKESDRASDSVLPPPPHHPLQLRHLCHCQPTRWPSEALWVAAPSAYLLLGCLQLLLRLCKLLLQGQEHGALLLLRGLALRPLPCP